MRVRLTAREPSRGVLDDLRFLRSPVLDVLEDDDAGGKAIESGVEKVVVDTVSRIDRDLADGDVVAILAHRNVVAEVCSGLHERGQAED